jgi:putative sigma-54 modulation protein
MQVNVAFRHMDPSPATSRYASEKLQHVVSKYVSGMDVESQVVFSTERFLNVANFTVSINGMTVKCVEKNEEMNAAIDLALDKLERQVRRFKKRIREHRPDHRRHSLTVQVLAAENLHDETEDAATDEPVVEAAADAAPAAPPTPATVRNLHTETQEAPFMTPADAIVHLELGGSDFFVFTHAETEQLSILYRREDGHFGLIQPVAAHR